MFLLMTMMNSGTTVISLTMISSTHSFSTKVVDIWANLGNSWKRELSLHRKWIIQWSFYFHSWVIHESFILRLLHAQCLQPWQNWGVRMVLASMWHFSLNWNQIRQLQTHCWNSPTLTMDDRNCSLWETSGWINQETYMKKNSVHQFKHAGNSIDRVSNREREMNQRKEIKQNKECQNIL
jgi:hypothetical protein